MLGFPNGEGVSSWIFTIENDKKTDWGFRPRRQWNKTCSNFGAWQRCMASSLVFFFKYFGDTCMNEEYDGDGDDYYYIMIKSLLLLLHYYCYTSMNLGVNGVIYYHYGLPKDIKGSYFQSRYLLFLWVWSKKCFKQKTAQGSCSSPFPSSPPGLLNSSVTPISALTSEIMTWFLSFHCCCWPCQAY